MHSLWAKPARYGITRPSASERRAGAGEVWRFHRLAAAAPDAYPRPMRLVDPLRWTSRTRRGARWRTGMPPVS